MSLDFTQFTHFRVSSPAPKVIHIQTYRPKKLNAYAKETWEQYRAIFQQLNKTDTRVIILSGTGKHFCAGLDLQDSLKHISNIKPTTGVSFIKNFQQCINSPVESHIPVVSISHGVSYGLALDILSATTIRFCTKDVKFSIKEIDIGIMADIGSLQRLGYLVNNQSKLNQLALTAQDFGSNEAKELGLVSDVFDSKNEAFDKALELAIAISKKYQPAVIGTKKHLELMSVNSDWTKHGLDQVARDNAKLMSDESYKKFFLGVLKKMRSKL